MFSFTPKRLPVFEAEIPTVKELNSVQLRESFHDGKSGIKFVSCTETELGINIELHTPNGIVNNTIHSQRFIKAIVNELNRTIDPTHPEWISLPE